MSISPDVSSIVYFGLLLGLTLQDAEDKCKQHSSREIIPILHQVIEPLFEVPPESIERTIRLRKFKIKLLDALYLCDLRAPASRLAKKWHLPQPAPPKALVRFARLKPDDPVPLVLAFQFLSEITCNFYDQGIALGLPISKIKNLTAECTEHPHGRLRVLDFAGPLTRQDVEKCMAHPVIKTSEDVASILEFLEANPQWQPDPASLSNNNSTNILNNNHISFLAPHDDWFTLGYMLGVDYRTLITIQMDYHQCGSHTCFYHMLNSLREKATISIGQLVSVVQRAGLEHIISHLPEPCKPGSCDDIPAIGFPHLHHQLTVSLLQDHADKWEVIGRFFQVPMTTLCSARVREKASNKEKLIRVLRDVEKQGDTLNSRYHELIALLQQPRS